MFSVLMSLYHKESVTNLIECFESLKAQTMKPNEIVLVVDGPISEELDITVKSYVVELNIKLIRLKENVGLGMALNQGLKHCNYDIIARMDTDDICTSNRFENQIYKFHKDEELALLGSAIIEFDEGNNERYKILPRTQEEIKEYCLWKNPFNHMTVVFRKNKVNSVGGYEHHFFMEDYNLWIRMISKGLKVENSDEILVRARVGKDMLKKRRGIKYIHSEWKLFRLKYKLLNISLISASYIFLLRVISRLVPLTILKSIYDNDRKSTVK